MARCILISSGLAMKFTVEEEGSIRLGSSYSSLLVLHFHEQLGDMRIFRSDSPDIPRAWCGERRQCLRAFSPLLVEHTLLRSAGPGTGYGGATS